MSILTSFVIGQVLTEPPYREMFRHLPQRGLGKQHQLQVRAARKPATILRITRQLRRAAERKARKASA